MTRPLGVASDPRDAARKLRLRLEYLGGLWVKAGQLLSLRRDIFSNEFCDELGSLQDAAIGFPFASVRTVVHEELKRPLEEVFDEFDETPIAAASVGQVHRARLLGRAVDIAVKVQRPYVADTFRRDFRALARVVWLLEHLAIAPNVRWSDMLWELKRIMHGELDYRLEATSIARMKQSLKPHRVYVPKVFMEASAQRVLSMEFVHGVFLSDYIRMTHADPERLARWRVENDIDHEEVGRRLYHTHTRQVFEDNLFHSDLHPGNIVLLRGSRIALIDFGDVGSIEGAKIQHYYMIFRAVAEHNYSKVADLFLLMAPALRGVDIAEVKIEIGRVMREWESHAQIRDYPFHDKSLTFAMQGIANVFRNYAIPMSWEFAQVNRAEITMDASLAYLIPHANYFDLIQDYQARAQRRAVRRALSGQTLGRQIGGLLEILDLSGTAVETLYFESERLRQLEIAFKGGADAAGFAADAFLRLTGQILWIGTGILVGAYSTRYVSSEIGMLCLGWIRSLNDDLAQAGDLVWLLVIAVSSQLAGTCRRVARRYRHRPGPTSL